MNRIIAYQKIESIDRCIRRIQEKAPESLDVLREDLDAQDIISVNLERAIQLCVDLAMWFLSEKELPVPATMGEAFESLSVAKAIDPSLAEIMVRAVGFRNISVHAYRKVDWAIVWSLIRERLPVFKEFSSAIHRSIS